MKRQISFIRVSEVTQDNEGFKMTVQFRNQIV